jgi:hypothetical protein
MSIFDAGESRATEPTTGGWSWKAGTSAPF